MSSVDQPTAMQAYKDRAKLIASEKDSESTKILYANAQAQFLKWLVKFAPATMSPAVFWVGVSKETSTNEKSRN